MSFGWACMSDMGHPGRHMSEFKVTLARIEAVDEGEQGKQIRAVFHIERDVDAKWGQFLIEPAFFTQLVYQGV